MISLGSVCISEYISFTDYKHAWQCSISQDQWHQPLVWLRAFVNQSSPPCKLIPSPRKKNIQSIRESVLMTVYCYKLLLHAWFVHLYDWTTTYKQVLKFYQGFIINNIWISTKAVKPRLMIERVVLFAFSLMITRPYSQNEITLDHKQCHKKKYRNTFQFTTLKHIFANRKNEQKSLPLMNKKKIAKNLIK